MWQVMPASVKSGPLWEAAANTGRKSDLVYCDSRAAKMIFPAAPRKPEKKARLAHAQLHAATARLLAAPELARFSLARLSLHDAAV